jgi:hypothetical protein
MSEVISTASITDGMLYVSTTSGRAIATPVERLPVNFKKDAAAVDKVLIATNHKGLFVDGLPITLKKLREHTDPMFAQQLLAP